MRSPAIRTAIRILAVLFSLVGVVVSYHMARMHLKSPHATTQPVATQPAAVAAATQPADEDLGFLDKACTTLLPNTNCEEVIHSRWGSIRFGNQQIPVAILGLYYFTCVFWWFLLIGDVTPSRGWVHILVACVVAVGLGTSVFFVYQMTQMTNWCPLCAVTHAANLLLFICLLLLWPRSVSLEPEAPAPAPEASASLFTSAPRPALAGPAGERVWPHWWMLAVTPLVALLSIWVEGLLLQQVRVVAAAPPSDVEELQKRLKSAEGLGEYYKKSYEHYNNRWEHTYTSWLIAPVLPISIEGEPVRGPENARHTIVVFSDFQCPTCKGFEDTLTHRIVPMAAQHGGARVIFKQWPISTKCNRTVTHDLHPAACPAALAAEAAFILGGSEAFWKMHDMLFETQAEWKTSRNFEPYAQRIGLDLKAFRDAMKSEEARRRIEADVEEGATLAKSHVQSGQMRESEAEFYNVNSTPSVFVNGKRLGVLHHVRTWQMIFANPGAGQRQPTAAPRPGQGPSTRPAGPLIENLQQ